MNSELWNKILNFDFDNSPSEYGFSTRLANENFWTKNFTEQAILEYKKFMYLAATSDLMVSPSQIVDTVWHQHLIFTQSYQDLCLLIGKQVQHIPSTHNKEEFQKFKQAKDRTKKLYQINFGEQPNTIWEYADMFDSLNLDKAKIKIRTFIICGILAFAVLIIPSYFLLRPIYIKLGNPNFIIGFISLALLTFIGLEFYNRKRLFQIAKQSDKNSFINNLQPLELVYLKTQQLSHVIHGTINELIEKNLIIVNPDNTLEPSGNGIANSIEQVQIMNTLKSSGKTHYPALLRQLKTKPIFWNTANCMDAFKKFFNKSKKFGNLFYLNFGILSVLLMLALARLTTGILRDKPVTQIFIATITLTVLVIFYLRRLTNLVSKDTIPRLYKAKILQSKEIEDDWQWSYFLLGSAALTSSLVPLVNYTEKNDNYWNSSSCGTSCGSSCGSSCSSCGGCGGGD